MSEATARWVAGALSGAAAIAITVYAAFEERTGPARCPDGMMRASTRCCGEGQAFDAGVCKGKPKRCAPTQVVTAVGCVARLERIALPGGTVALYGPDWDGQRQTGSGKINVEPFEIDAAEVTVARWEHCRVAKRCVPLKKAAELGHPVTGVTPDEAEAFCRFAGGQVATAPQWILAASGSEMRRFPWGFTGLVCRRAAFGLASGPCAHGSEGPELAGSRPDGATPEGILDLAGNVAEWTRERDGRYRARGGSFRARTPAELKGWAAVGKTGAADDVGFRCAFPSKGSRPN